MIRQYSMSGQFRRQLLNCAAVLAIVPVQAHAQTADQADTTSAAQASTSDIVVTGSRIVRDGYSAPTPVNVLGAADILAQRPSNIANLVNTLPSVAGGTLTSANSSANVSSATAGLASVNLRGLGVGRTLVLIDGRRTPASTFSGVVDLNTIPQELVQRVEVVTGGASAQYGSDAVGGVVNFILDDKFKGLKLGADTGITTYGDGHNYRFTGTAGLSLMDDRLHILVSGEYFHQDGIDEVPRSWNNRGHALYLNPAYTATNGAPEYLVGSGVGATTTEGGLINSGPLRGTYFAGDGVTGQFNYGTTNSTSAPWIVGGDWRRSMEGLAGTMGLQPTEERIGVFNHIAFDVTPDVQLYGQFSWNRYEGQGFAGMYGDVMTIAGDNAYLLTQYPQVAAAMQANGLNSIDINLNRAGRPVWGTDNSRQLFRYLAGVKGKFSLFGRPWSWDAYYQKGVAKTHEQTTNNANVARLDLATDAVLSNGQIVCRSTLTDPANGCIPMDRLGTTGGPSAAALAYIFGPEQPWRRQTIKQDLVAASMSGQLFDLPGGPAAIALGVEWRKDQDHSRVGATTSSGWELANYKPNNGEITVKEGFLEVALPLFTGFNLDAAGRYTDYSTSGSVQTWKVGSTYSPIDDIRFRAAYSHDIRAPNMQELFLVGGFLHTGVVLPANSPSPGPNNDVARITSGNSSLKPEKANTLTAGVVVTPRFLPGFSASFDYYDIKLKGAIGAVSAQQTVDFCYSGLSEFCNNLIFSGNILTTVLQQPVNFASQHTRGFDIEASYSTPLSAISANLPGNFRIHAAATHFIKNVVDNRVFPVNYAGVIEDGANANPSSPSWQYRVSTFYEINPVTINLVARGFNDGVYSNNYIECTSSCPTSTSRNRTISNNRIKGSLYFDGSVSVKIPTRGNETQLSLIVNNMFNREPTLIGIDVGAGGLPYPMTARPLYDTLGRVFRLSVTTKF